MICKKSLNNSHSKFSKLETLGYTPSVFNMNIKDILSVNHNDNFDYMLEHMYHIDSQDREDHVRIQGFITKEDFIIGLEEIKRSVDMQVQYVHGYIKITFKLYKL